MSSSQVLVVTWIEWAAAGALLLLAARIALGRVRQPADRIMLILITFGAAALIPALMALAPIPAWRLGLVAAPNGEPVSPPPASGEAADLSRSEPPQERGPVLLSPSPHIVVDAAPAEAVRREAAPAMGNAVPAPVPRGPNPWLIAAAALIVVQAAASLFLAFQWLVGMAHLRKLVSASVPASSSLSDLWREVTAGRGGSVRLRVSDAVDTPLTFGWFSPTVIVPGAVAAGDPRALRFCLAHEWSHVDRRDLFAWGFSGLCEFGLWFQPLYWMLRRELRVCQDLLADDRAAAAGGDSIEYSELLVRFARNRVGKPVAGAMAFLDRPSQLARRVRTLLAPGLSLKARAGVAFCLLAGTGVLTGALLLSAVRMSAVQAAEQKPAVVETNRETPSALPSSETAATKVVEKPANTPAPDEKKSKEETLHYGGSVVDKQTGKGIAGAMVVVRRSKSNAQENTIIEESKHTTDADGKFAFVIPPEQVAISALYIELDVDHPDYAARKGFGYALSMIRKNEPLGERPFFEKTELDPSDPVTGVVVDPSGKPLAGVKLQGYSKASAADFRDYGSFTETRTDDAGKFRLPLVKGGVGVMWVLPKDFASTSRAINKERGDLGTITLRPGVRVSGRVLNVAGEPIAGIPVNIDYSGDGNETVNNLPVATSIERSALSDKEGRFAFDPLPSGSYRVIPEEHRSDPIERDRTKYKIPGVFLPLTVKIQEGTPAAPIEIQASPHVVVHAQIYDSQGKKTRGHEFFLFGQLDGQYWFGQGRPDAEGTIAVQVPHGLENVRMQLMTNEHGALRFRRGPGKELENRKDDVELGTLNDDIEGFEIIKYKAPIVIVKAVDVSGALVPGYRVAAAYPWGMQRYILEGEQRSDLSFEKQNDGRYRTSQMLPDEDVKFTIAAAGYETATETVRLPEGETKELVVTLKKAAETPKPVADAKPGETKAAETKPE